MSPGRQAKPIHSLVLRSLQWMEEAQVAATATSLLPRSRSSTFPPQEARRSQSSLSLIFFRCFSRGAACPPQSRRRASEKREIENEDYADRLRKLPLRSSIESVDCRLPNAEWFAPEQRENDSHCFTSAKIRFDLEPNSRSAVSYWDHRSPQIPALTSPVAPPIIRPCLAPMPSAASRATPQPTATSISTTSSRAIVRNGTAIPVASLLTGSPPTAAPHSPSKSSSDNRHW